MSDWRILRTSELLASLFTLVVGTFDEARREELAHGVARHIDAVTEALDAERAKLAKLREAVEIVEDLVDEDDCWYDHHGYCQAHGWMATEPSCPHMRAKTLLGRLSGEEATDAGRL